jgi:hypothetical protein
MGDMLRHILLEDPLPLWILCGLVAIACLAVWSRTRAFTPLAIAAGCVVAAGAVGLIAALVETDRERVQRSVSLIARAAESGDADRLIERISPEYKNGPYGKEELAFAVQQALKKVHITADDPIINMDDRQATVTQQYHFESAGGGQTLPYPPVTWEGKFAPDPDGQWRLRSATAIYPERMTPEAAARLLH